MPNGKYTIDDIRTALQKKGAISSSTAQLMTLSLLSDLWDKVSEDHEKVDQMFPDYKRGKWAVLLIGGLGLTDITLRLIAAAAAAKVP